MLVSVSDRIPDVITERDCLESGDDRNFAITCLKLLGFFGVREAAEARRLRLQGREPPARPERIQLGWRRNALIALYFGYPRPKRPHVIRLSQVLMIVSLHLRSAQRCSIAPEGVVSR